MLYLESAVVILAKLAYDGIKKLLSETESSDVTLEKVSDETRNRVVQEAQTLLNHAQKRTPVRPCRIFLCHASEDKPYVRDIFCKLKEIGHEPWLDEECLLPGQLWRNVIPDVVRKSDVILVFLSVNAVDKKGYVQKEICMALDVADEQPEGAIFIIPARIDECVVPDRIKKYHYADLFKPQGFGRLESALAFIQERLDSSESSP